MSTIDRYAEAGMKRPKHARRVSEETHPIDPATDPSAATPAPRKKTSRRTTTSTRKA